MMESMGMANWFGELMESYMEMMACDMGVYNGEELDPNIDFAEMDKLEQLLVEAGIPYEKSRVFGGKQLQYPCKGSDRVCSVILHKGSYGRSEGLLEIMGLLTDEELECDTVAGHLTADDVFGRIKRHWGEKGENDGNV
jgi:hypothetical protein